jgi:hypothetical protein
MCIWHFEGKINEIRNQEEIRVTLQSAFCSMIQFPVMSPTKITYTQPSPVRRHPNTLVPLGTSIKIRMVLKIAINMTDYYKN